MQVEAETVFQYNARNYQHLSFFTAKCFIELLKYALKFNQNHRFLFQLRGLPEKILQFDGASLIEIGKTELMEDVNYGYIYDKYFEEWLLLEDEESIEWYFSTCVLLMNFKTIDRSEAQKLNKDEAVGMKVAIPCQEIKSILEDILGDKKLIHQPFFPQIATMVDGKVASRCIFHFHVLEDEYSMLTLGNYMPSFKKFVPACHQL